MKVLVALLLSLSFPALPVAPKPPAPVDHHVSRQAKRRGGTWYFAENGHAVFCYGPVLIVPVKESGLQRVATFCRDGQTMVPLKD
jgi:hypothetical protein